MRNVEAYLGLRRHGRTVDGARGEQHVALRRGLCQMAGIGDPGHVHLREQTVVIVIRRPESNRFETTQRPLPHLLKLGQQLRSVVTIVPGNDYLVHYPLGEFRARGLAQHLQVQEISNEVPMARDESDPTAEDRFPTRSVPEPLAPASQEACTATAVGATIPRPQDPSSSRRTSFSPHQASIVELKT